MNAESLAECKKVLLQAKAGRLNGCLIEGMACPGGCIGGAGQPYHHGDVSILKKRQAALYTEDQGKVLRKSHENPFVQEVYNQYFKEPLSQKAHELLHTHYHKKERL